MLCARDLSAKCFGEKPAKNEEEDTREEKRDTKRGCELRPYPAGPQRATWAPEERAGLSSPHTLASILGAGGGSGMRTPRQVRPLASEKETLAAWGQGSEGCDSYRLDGTNNPPE